jgi:hypothetical protein
MLISRSASACLLALLTSHLAAQEQDTPSDQMGSYAQVADASVDLRCFPTENSPTFGDTMVDGAVVIVGESYGDFRQVVLPLGPVGYVHKDFATEPEGGMLMTSGNNVAFRYRPRSGEAPVELLPDETELLVVGEDGDWWQVRFRAGQAWMPLAALRVFEEPNDTLVASYAEFGKQQRKVVDDLEAARVQAVAEAQYSSDLQRRLDTLVERFDAEVARPAADQDYDVLGADLSTLISELPTDSVVLINAELFARNIRDRQLVVEATRVILEEPVPAPDPSTLVREPVADPLARFDSVGWLRFRPSASGLDRFVVEKGGQTLFWLTCSSGRYDMELFDGVEVGLIGGKDRPNRESMRVVDVEKIEVLGLAR